MKKIAVLLVAVMSTALLSKAQCNKTIKWNCSKYAFLDTTGNVQRENEEPVEVVTTPKTITITRGASGEHLMSGDVNDYSCNWKDQQNGKTTFKSLLLEGDKTRHATVTIQAIDGKTTILLRAEEEETMIRLNIDSFEEVKQ